MHLKNENETFTGTYVKCMLNYEVQCYIGLFGYYLLDECIVRYEHPEKFRLPKTVTFSGRGDVPLVFLCIDLTSIFVSPSSTNTV